MRKTELKKLDLTHKIADHLLQKGLMGFSLRTLGQSIGMSDRMLLHYFADKDELLSLALQEVSNRLINYLDSLKLGLMHHNDLIKFLATLLDQETVKPYTQIWLELIGYAVRQKGFYSNISNQIMSSYHDWIKKILISSDESLEQSAALILVIVEGIVLMRASDKHDLVDSAIVELSGLFQVKS